ncbi:RNA 2',3'-cyclic phosphodiesterase [Vreelandella rituensis]|uniref:RNA 2',3'-cyclic phosphodiesterase n=1 Tax=Vreelandella rituensis TaxID=2282306 RepID=A0A368UAC6_9GAMM|nr:RNA 2',3'-cyclic phosphodiesterase [Halomonas rituensis]RCV93536.1 RNA 2',3'-cyclic phosphodiesterase [Halomonas rituensis]
MRLFLALLPAPELCKRFGRLAGIAHARCGGRRIPEPNMHLTLAFIGELERARAVKLAAWVQRLSIEPGHWRLDSWGSFRGPRIVWVGGQRPEPELTHLHQILWNALESRGIHGRPADYVPHVTLLRGADSLDTTPLPEFELEWHYHRLELVHSITDDQGARYTTLAHSNSTID